MRMLELAVHALERLLRAYPLRDVVDHDEPGPPAAPADEVTDAVDLDRLAVLARMAEDAAINRIAGLVAQEIAPLVGPVQIRRLHAEEFLARIAIEAQRGVVDREEAQILVVQHPHRQRARFEEHPVATG